MLAGAHLFISHWGAHAREAQIVIKTFGASNVRRQTQETTSYYFRYLYHSTTRSIAHRIIEMCTRSVLFTETN